MLVEEEKGKTIPQVPKHGVTFSVEGGHGTLKAKADGVTETATSPISIEQGKKVTFTAEPAAGYMIKEWKVDGAVIKKRKMPCNYLKLQGISMNSGEGEIRTHGTCVHMRSRRAP